MASDMYTPAYIKLLVVILRLTSQLALTCQKSCSRLHSLSRRRNSDTNQRPKSDMTAQFSSVAQASLSNGKCHA